MKPTYLVINLKFISLFSNAVALISYDGSLFLKHLKLKLNREQDVYICHIIYNVTLYLYLLSYYNATEYFLFGKMYLVLLIIIIILNKCLRK